MLTAGHPVNRLKSRSLDGTGHPVRTIVDRSSFATHAVRIKVLKRPGGERESQVSPAVVAVDFDGTIVEDSASLNLEDAVLREGVKEAFERLRSAGIRIVVWTASVHWQEVGDWLTAQGVPLDAVNDNLWDTSGSTSRKINAGAYVDDRAVPVDQDEDWDDLADRVLLQVLGKPRQPAGSWEELQELSLAAQPELEAMLKELNPQRTVRLGDDLPLGELEAELCQPGTTLVLAPPKARKRAKEKVESDYGGDWSKLLDLNRAAVAFDTRRELEAAAEQLREQATLARVPKDRFKIPLANGYRDLLTNYRLPCGAICEVQFHLKSMLIAREREKLAYDVVRAIHASLEAEGREDLTPAEAEAVRRARKEAKRIYARAWGECLRNEARAVARPANRLKSLLAIVRKNEGSFFETCDRDDEGHCKPGEGGGKKPASETGGAADEGLIRDQRGEEEGGGTGKKPQPTPKPDKKKPADGDQPKRAAPGSQLEPATLAKLKELGADKLPPADVPASEVRVNLDAGDGGALVTWKQRSKSGRVSQQSAYTPAFHAKNAAEKWERVERVAPMLSAIEDKLAEQLQDESLPQRKREAAAITSCIRETGLRPTDGAESVKHGHFGISSLQGRHVKVQGDEVHLDFIGKEGVRNQTVVRDPTNVAFIKGALENTGPKDFLFKEANSGDAIKTLKEVSKSVGGPEDILVKDLRTVNATRWAEEAVANFRGPPPPLSGDPKKDAKLVAKAVLTMSAEVSRKLNNNPEMARDNYIHPKVFKGWLERLQTA